MYRPVDVSPALAHVHVTCKFARTCNKRTFAHVTYGFNAALRVGLLRAISFGGSCMRLRCACAPSRLTSASII